jgi:hypothetical protein
MRKELNSSSSELALERVLLGLERELLDATDEELVAAAADLGMDVTMKGSAAFLGVLHSLPRRIEDIFDCDDLRADQARLPNDENDGD